MMDRPWDATLAAQPEARAVALVEVARAFEARMATLPADVHPGWGLPPAIDPQGEARQRAAAMAWLEARCGGLPMVERLLEPAARWVLLPRAALLQHLVGLALARRPGVLRCCLDRERREALKAAVGELWAPLWTQALEGGDPPDEVLIHWNAEQWSCQGYVDWIQLLGPQDGVLRRCVRLQLPRRVLAALREHAAPAELSSVMAFRQLSLPAEDLEASTW